MSFRVLLQGNINFSELCGTFFTKVFPKLSSQDWKR